MAGLLHVVVMGMWNLDFACRRDAGKLVFMGSVADRAYSGEADFMAVRQFLIDSYAAFGEMFNWGHERWEIVRFSGNAACELADDRPWERFVRIWESDGRIVGVAHPESGGDLFVEIHPDYRYLEDEMFAWAEQNRSPARRPDTPFSTWIKDGDSVRESVLEKRGWTRIGLDGHMRRRPMRAPLPNGPVVDGYIVRSLDLTTDEDSEGRAAASRSAFGNKRTGELMKVLAWAPGYRPDLDLAAIAADGTFAAYTTAWWDEVNRYVIFEPVGTHEEHRRRGLASAVIAEGLRRALELGAEAAYVGSGAGAPANHLYESLGFTEVVDDVRWDAPAP
ncbi:GNAT family N-acetyltransferase [Actinomycetota bacterium]